MSPRSLGMKLEFHGAAGGVSGSHMILHARDLRIGIDAGLFQGGDTDRNQDGFGQVFLNHGEDRASEALAEAIRSEFGARVSIAKMNQSFSL